MRAVSSENGPTSEDVRGGSRGAARPVLLRKTRLRSLAMEPLEARTLLSTLPPITTNPAANSILAPSTGNQVNPSIAIDPNDPTKMVAVWVQDDPAHPYTNYGGTPVTSFVEAAYYSVQNGVGRWTPISGNALGDSVPDFSVNPATAPLPLVTDASVSFDANHNFYIADEAHKADYSAGQLTTERFSFSGAAPVQTMSDNVAARWTSGLNAIFKPILAADGNRASANGQTDPATAYTTANPAKSGPFGAVYIATQSQANASNPTQNSQALLLTSFDGGQNFARATVGTSGQATAADVVVSQGNTSGSVKAGQATIVWDDTNPNGPADVLRSNSSVPDPNTYSNSVSPGAPIATPPQPTPANTTITPQVTTIPLLISGAPLDFSLVKLTAAVNLTYPDLREISVQLVAPNNQSLFLLKNGETATAAAANNVVTTTVTPVAPPQGAGNPSRDLNATFDDTATTPIKNSTVTSGTFTPEAGTLTNAFGGINNVNGQWKLVITAYVPDPGQASVNSFSLSLNGVRISGENTVLGLNAGGGVRGNVNGGNFPDAGSTPAVPNRGVSPAPVLASDNTLGPNSPNEGRIYLAYVDRDTNPNNPADNTDVFTVSSGDGGKTWSNPVKVNDDNSQKDGFSESSRAQFQPAVAVDPASGMLAVSFFDARNDAARSRVATYVGTSIDGGKSYSPETFVNAPIQGFDQITNTVTTLGPIPDNQSAGGGIADTTYNFGDHQGLIFFAGSVMPVWSSNADGGQNLAKGQNFNRLSQITIAHATAPIGPRVYDITQGPVGEPGDGLNPNPNGTSGPALGNFVVTFDRPIDVNSFLPSDVTVTFRDGNVNDSPVVYGGGVTIRPQSASNGFAQTFTVTLATPQTAAGTYEVTIRPAGAADIRTDVQYYNGGNLVSAEPMDQDTIPADAGKASNVFTTSNAVNQGVLLPLIVPGPHVVGSTVAGGGFGNLVLNGTAGYIDVKFDRAMDPSTLVGKPVVVRVMGPAGQINDTFTVTQPNANDPTTYRVNFFLSGTTTVDPQTLNGTYTVTLASSIKDTQGNALDTNLNAGLYRFRGVSPYGASTPLTFAAALPPGGVALPAPGGSTLLVPVSVPASFLVQGVSVKLNITYPYDPDLTATLLAPGAVVNPDGTVSGPHARLFSGNGTSGTQANFQDTTFVSSTNPGVTPISKGGPPYFNATFDALDPFTAFQGVQANGTWQLYIQDAQTKPGSGSVNSFALTLLQNLSAASNGLGEPVADQATVSFRVLNDQPTNAQSTNTWTSAGPSSIDGGARAGRVGGLAVDPSDPSGNTVYAGGASGGIWKTTDFLTPKGGGPTWTPLTDFGPTSDNNIGGIAIFPVNNDPNQSIVIAATGEADAGTSGRGFLRSLDGGAHWQFLDSTDNSKPYAQRDQLFAKNGTSAFKIVVDPRLTTSGGVIIYAALSGSGAGPVAGIWRSLDTGIHWTRLKAGNATDVALDPLSGIGAPGGNLQNVYAAFGGDGVYASSNQGGTFLPLLGTLGDPLIQDSVTNQKIPVVTPGGSTPNGASKQRIHLAKPVVLASTDINNPSAEDRLYEGWLYALVSNGGSYEGLYLTKDFGQNWTKVHIASATGAGQGAFNPSNNVTLSDYDPLGGQGFYNLDLAIDPTNPNVVYIGGSSNPPPGSTDFGVGLLRVDTTGLLDAHNAVPFLGNQPDGGLALRNSAGGVTVSNINNPVGPLDPGTGLPYINLIRNPANFFANGTFNTDNVKQFNNTGADARWIPFSDALGGSTDQHRLVTVVDPVTGHARLIFGDDQGVFTGVDNNGSYVPGGIGTQRVPTGSRNGNLTLTQFYYGAVDPSAHDPAGNTRPVTLYGGAQDTGGTESNSVLGTGDVGWVDGATGGGGDFIGVATDPTGSGSVYRFIVPADAGTDFFQVDGVGKTFGLTTGPKDPQWGYAPIGWDDYTATGLFAVNPVSGDQIVISSGGSAAGSAGTIYRTLDRGSTWFVIGSPSDLDSSYAPALAFGAPGADPSDPTHTTGNLGDFIYAGTVNGNIFVTTAGGGTSAGSAWSNISAGLAGSGIIKQIIANPNPGSHEAYAVAKNGVYHIADSVPSASNPTPTWTKINGNLFSLLTPATGDTVTTVGDVNGVATQTPQLNVLTSLQVDWRYVLPNQTGNASAGTHPVLYVAGDSGVYRSLDNGASWTDFPNADPQIDRAPADGGFLPHVPVTSLSLADGNINPVTGRATVSQAGGVSDPSLLTVSTYGQGSFLIQLAPIVLPNATATQPTNIYLDPTAPNNLAKTVNGVEYTTSSNPVIDGISEQSAFGNAVTLALFDETPGSANFGQPIPLTGSTVTDAGGHFALTVGNYAPFLSSGTYTVGIQATDQSGTKGNIADFTFVIDNSTPPPPTKLTLDPSTDSGPLKNDDVTNYDNSPSPAGAPIIDVSGILPGATVVLLRNGVEVGRVANTAGGTIQVPDLNGGAKIPDGTYAYTAYQISTLQKLSAVSAPALSVVIDATPPAAAVLALDPASDTGAPNDGATKVTRDNNSTLYPAPQFDINAGVAAGGSIELFRAPVVKGVTGAAVLVNNVFSPGGGLTSILDTNNGAVIPDGQYVYTTRLLDLAGNASAPSNGVAVTISSKPPLANPPAPPVLEAGSDTGTFATDGVTADNNSTAALAPKFDAGTGTSPVPAGATVQLYRTPADAQFNPTGGAVLVATVYSPAGGLVPITDANNGGGTIPDGHYLYTVQLTSLAGVTGSMSAGTRITILSATPAQPTPLVLDPTSDTGVSSTDAVTQITVRASPKFDAGGSTPVQRGATVVLYRAPLVNGVAGTAVAVATATDTAGGTVVVSDPGVISDGKYQYTVRQVDLAGNAGPIGSPTTVTYVTAQPSAPPAPVLDPSNPGDPKNGQTSNPNPVIDVTVTPTQSETDLNLPLSVALVRDGSVVLNTAYNSAGGQLQLSDPGPGLPPGMHTYQIYVTDLAGNKSPLSGTLTVTVGAAAAGSLTLDPKSNTGPPGSNTTSVKSPTFDAAGTTPNSTLRLLRDGQTVNSVSTGTGGLVTIQDPGPLPDGTYVYTTVQVDANKNASPPGPPLTVTINTTVPTAPVLVRLDTTTDSGVKGDNVTNAKSPTFDVTGVVSGDTLQLLRNGVLVPSQSVVTGSTATVTDTGPAPDGTYTYSVRQVNAAGNPSASGGGISVTVLTASPATPVVALDPASRSGPNTAGTTSPSFDITVSPGNSVQLYRGDLLVKTIASAPGTPVVLQDFGPLSDGGTYTYTAKQVDVAGNASALSTPLTITVNTTLPVLPATPTQFALAPSSDSGIKGDRITDVRMPAFTGKADPGATINLYAGTSQVVGTATADKFGNFTVQIGTPAGLGSPLTNGYYQLQAQAYANGHVSGGSTPLVIKIAPEPGDFTGNGNSQPALFRRTTASQLQWFVLNDAQINGRAFGASATDVPIVGDFTGDGRMDLMLFTPSTGNWTIESPTTNYTAKPYLTAFGAPPAGSAASHPDFYIPAPADYSGSGTESAAVYETTTGKWYIQGRAGVVAPITPFQPNDVPVPADYDNTGRAELALYRPSTATWYIQGPAGSHNSPSGVYTVGFGGNGDVPVPGAYFATAGDHSDAVAVWRPGLGEYLIRTPNGGTATVPFAVGDIPAPGDYNGSGVLQPAVYRPGSNPPEFLAGNPTGGLPQVVAPIGGKDFVPLTAPYSYRALRSGGGTISAFVARGGSVNLASTAVLLSASSTTAPAPQTPPAPVKAAVTLLRVRPAQAAAATPAVKTHPVDEAIATLGGRLFGGLL